MVLLNSYNDMVLLNSYNDMVLLNCYNDMVLLNSYNDMVLLNCYNDMVLLNCYNDMVLLNCYNLSVRQKCLHVQLKYLSWDLIKTLTIWRYTYRYSNLIRPYRYSYWGGGQHLFLALNFHYITDSLPYKKMILVIVL
jgi:hypothetical protein